MIIKGTTIIKLNPEELQTWRDAGANDIPIIHKVLDRITSQLDLISRGRISFHDCVIKEDETEVLPF